MNDKYYGYRITNLVNNKIYIGIHKFKFSKYRCLPKVGDIKFEDGYIGSGRSLLEAYRKYGLENFQMIILYETDNETDISNWETDVVNEDFISRKDTYNLRVGGYLGGVFNIDVINKIKESLKKVDRCKDKNSFYGKVHTDELKKYNSEFNKKLWADPNSYYNSKEYRDKLSVANSKESNGFYGKKHTQESKNKMKASLVDRIPWNKGKKHERPDLRGKTRSQESKNKMKESHKKRYDAGYIVHNSQSIINNETGIQYPSKASLCRNLGITGKICTKYIKQGKFTVL